MLNCKHCGHEVGDSANFCPQCGRANLAEDEMSRDSSPPSNGMEGSLIAIGIPISVVIWIVLFFASPIVLAILGLLFGFRPPSTDAGTFGMIVATIGAGGFIALCLLVEYLNWPRSN